MRDTKKLLSAFKSHLERLNRSPKTIESYTGYVKSFLNDIDDVNDVRNVSTAVIERWIERQFDHRTKTGQPYSLSSICIKIRSVKRFFEYLSITGHILIDPSEPVKEPKIKKGLSRPVLTVDEAEKILNQPDLSTSYGVRDRTILEVFYSTGIRLNELWNLLLTDPDFENSTLRVSNGKGKKDRIIPLGHHALLFLKGYLAKVRPVFMDQRPVCPYLFVDRFGKQIDRQVIIMMVKRNAGTAGIKKKVSPHVFRHTFATSLIRNNADIRAVQQMMGHADLRTTQEYTRVIKSDLKKVHNQTHPREIDDRIKKEK